MPDHQTLKQLPLNLNKAIDWKCSMAEGLEDFFFRM